MSPNRRTFIILGGVGLMLGIVAPVRAVEGDRIDPLKLMAPMAVPDKVAGDPAAKVTVIEYASPTCPHCARFANDLLEPLREKYVATGKVKFIIRPFVRNALDAAVFMLAEAAAKAVDTPADGFTPEAVAAYDNVLAGFFKSQDVWAAAPQPLDAIKKVATQLGFSEDSFKTALTDTELFAALEKMRDQALNEFALTGTPTFYVNGKALSGDKTLEQWSAEIDPLL